MTYKIALDEEQYINVIIELYKDCADQYRWAETSNPEDEERFFSEYNINLKIHYDPEWEAEIFTFPTEEDMTMFMLTFNT